jgi:hypothetical protein
MYPTALTMQYVFLSTACAIYHSADLQKPRVTTAPKTTSSDALSQSHSPIQPPGDEQTYYNVGPAPTLPEGENVYSAVDDSCLPPQTLSQVICLQFFKFTYGSIENSDTPCRSPGYRLPHQTV